MAHVTIKCLCCGNSLKIQHNIRPVDDSKNRSKIRSHILPTNMTNKSQNSINTKGQPKRVIKRVLTPRQELINAVIMNDKNVKNMGVTGYAQFEQNCFGHKKIHNPILKRFEFRLSNSEKMRAGKLFHYLRTSDKLNNYQIDELSDFIGMSTSSLYKYEKMFCSKTT